MREATTKQTVIFIAFIIVVFICFSIKPPLGIMVFSMGMLVALLYGLADARRIRKTGELVSGYIVDYTIDRDGDATPIIEFETTSKEKIAGHPFISSNFHFSPSLKKKEKPLIEVRVIYDKNKPSDFILPDYQTTNNLAFGVIGFFALVMLALSIYDLLTGRLSNN